MSAPAKKRATYEDLNGIPENMTGEIIDGELWVTPRPSREHVNASSSVGYKIGPPYQFGEGGPGGWIILIESEIKLGENILVPDLAGWRKERFPVGEEHNWISVAPNWVCEVLSPGTLRKDRVTKMSFYLEHAIAYYWLIDPAARTLEVLRFEDGKWVIAGVYEEDDRMRAEPFQEIEINLGDLWLGE
jgi:Uma2 family endonuclease